MSAVRGEKWVRTLERSLHMLSDTQRWGCLCRVNQITVSSLILCHAHGCFHFSLLSSLIYYWCCTIAQAYIRLSLRSSQSRLGLEPPQTRPICYRRVVCVNCCVWFPINHFFECPNSQICFFFSLLFVIFEFHWLFSDSKIKIYFIGIWPHRQFISNKNTTTEQADKAHGCECEEVSVVNEGK